MNAYLNQYQSNQYATASPEQILIMLYDGAIRFVHEARTAINDGNKAVKAKAISRTVAIVTEFSNTLDFEVGGEIAEDLYRLYDYMVRELTAVNIREDLKKLDSVEKILVDLRSGFVEAIEIKKQEDSKKTDNAPNEHRSAVAF